MWGSAVTSTMWAETVSRSQLGRLTVAELSDQTLTYGFGEVAGCSGANNEPLAGLNGNRTSQTRTVDGVPSTDTYCFDTADRLTSASQVNGAIVCDAHGNITQLGDISFTHDSLDRHVSTVLPTGQTVSLERDIDGSVLSRTVTAPNQPVEVLKYSAGVVQFYLNSANQVTGTTQSLPGGVSVTDANSTSTTTFTSLQGNACLTVTASGTTRTRFDPFGTPLTALPDTLPGSAEAGFGTVAGKLTDTLSAFGLIDMGARLYSTVLGRFLQVDPVPGGGVNAYSYPPDPVNMNDYSGKFATKYIMERTFNSKLKVNSSANANRLGRNHALYSGASWTEVGLAVASGVLTVLALTAAATCLACTAIALTLKIASTAIGIGSTAMACTRELASFDCVTGVIGATLGVSSLGMSAFKLTGVASQITGTAADSMSIGGIGISLAGSPVASQRKREMAY